MSFRYVTCVMVDCDECATTLGPDDDLVDAAEAASSQEWCTDGEHHWCPDCQDLPHECAPDPEDRQACARCGGPIGGGT